MSIQETIQERMKRLRQGYIQSLYNEAIQVSSWKAPTDMPHLKSSNSAAQLAADAENYRTAAARVCTEGTIVPIGQKNIDRVEAMHVTEASPLGFQPPPHTANISSPGIYVDQYWRNLKRKQQDQHVIRLISSSAWLNCISRRSMTTCASYLTSSTTTSSLMQSNNSSLTPTC